MTTTHAYLLLDSAQVNDLMVQIYQLEDAPEIHLLYQNTRYHALADSGPLLIHLPTGSRLEQHFVEHWQASAGLWLESDGNESALVEHLRSLVHVRIGSDVTVLLRYHDPRIMRHWLPDLPPEECDRMMGPMRRIRLPVLHGEDQIDEIRRTHPATTAQYNDTPWLRLSDEQVERLNRAQLMEFDLRLLRHIDQYFPDCLAGWEPNTRFAWAAACRQGAQDHGYSAADEVAQWASLCSVLGVNFPKAPAHHVYQQILATSHLPGKKRLERLVLELQCQMLTDKEVIV
ncbi:protein of unknown function [Halopseudomonas litoralis]|uniref:DUF4123 domain-containing protein n=1 Tax=Halopseudomonas litoralis TaxID=797277 RepID=A0A1H1TLG2_9GAMM|nr:DUF4123 domain-containing protein [Halopseudomonas litoralis]SDS61093.1 protein of unknown function [Halopseudomonas litoralis]